MLILVMSGRLRPGGGLSVRPGSECTWLRQDLEEHGAGNGNLRFGNDAQETDTQVLVNKFNIGTCVVGLWGCIILSWDSRCSSLLHMHCTVPIDKVLY